MDAPVGKRITKLANRMADLSRRHGRLANRKAKRERKRDRLEDKVAALGRKQNDLMDNLAGLAGKMVDSLEELKTPAETDLPPFAAQPPPPVADAETSYGSYAPPHPPPCLLPGFSPPIPKNAKKISRNRKLPLVFF